MPQYLADNPGMSMPKDYYNLNRPVEAEIETTEMDRERKRKYERQERANTLLYAAQQAEQYRNNMEAYGWPELAKQLDAFITASIGQWLLERTKGD